MRQLRSSISKTQGVIMQNSSRAGFIWSILHKINANRAMNVQQKAEIKGFPFLFFCLHVFDSNSLPKKILSEIWGQKDDLRIHSFGLRGHFSGITFGV
jgi:CRISPR/Cas system endoribonuclease Cas6 (RAMP superfamily)